MCEEVWNYGRHHGFAIIWKDSDFLQGGLLSGLPPKIVWLRIGNCIRDELVRFIMPPHSSSAARDAWCEQCGQDITVPLSYFRLVMSMRRGGSIGRSDDAWDRPRFLGQGDDLFGLDASEHTAFLAFELGPIDVVE